MLDKTAENIFRNRVGRLLVSIVTFNDTKHQQHLCPWQPQGRQKSSASPNSSCTCPQLDPLFLKMPT